MRPSVRLMLFALMLTGFASLGGTFSYFTDTECASSIIQAGVWDTTNTDLYVDISQSNLEFKCSSSILKGTTLQATGDSCITIDKIQVYWNTDEDPEALLTGIKIGKQKQQFYSGQSNSGDVLDGKDYKLCPGKDRHNHQNKAVSITFFFDGRAAYPFTLKFLMSDGSTEVVNIDLSRPCQNSLIYPDIAGMMSTLLSEDSLMADTDSNIIDAGSMTGDDTASDDKAAIADDTVTDDNAAAEDSAGTGDNIANVDDTLTDDNTVTDDNAVADDSTIAGDDTIVDGDTVADDIVTGDGTVTEDTATGDTTAVDGGQIADGGMDVSDNTVTDDNSATDDNTVADSDTVNDDGNTATDGDTVTGDDTATDGSSATDDNTAADDDTVTDEDPSHYFSSNSSIDIKKYTNGEDADTAPGPDIGIGSPVTWTYNVNNTGNVNLTNVVVTDNMGVSPVYVSGDNGDGILQPGEIWVYNAIGTATAGQYANIGNVTADHKGTPVTDEDASHYFCPNSSIDIKKYTNGEDADSAPGPDIGIGSPVTWTYNVTNTGNVNLTNVVVTDNMGVSPVYVSGDNGDGILQPGEVWVYSATGTATAGQYANIGNVTADYKGTPVTDEDASHYFGSSAATDIEKYTDGEDDTVTDDSSANDDNKATDGDTATDDDKLLTIMPDVFI